MSRDITVENQNKSPVRAHKWLVSLPRQIGGGKAYAAKGDLSIWV
ncbi:hypothetical protein TH47_00090 [Thalassospira sp. MCCC 1A02803]|nr:hypothetical protein TH47_00090 [Thalassospira sp. MCCC 1A02803]